LLLGLFFASALAQPSYQPGVAEGPPFGLLAAETGAGLLTGTALTAGTVFGLYAALSPSGDSESQLIALYLIGLAGTVVVYPLGSAAGVSLVGSASQEQGSFGAAYLGALIGLPIGYGIAVGGASLTGHSPVLQWTCVVLGALVPPAGACAGYSLTRSPVPGLSRLDRRLLLPGVGFRSEAGRETIAAIDVRLLTVRF
jgi:hypothetical protein